jgi:hypothetical protein
MITDPPDRASSANDREYRGNWITGRRSRGRLRPPTDGVSYDLVAIAQAESG